MNKQNTLAGTPVLVKPNLTDDPANKKNQVGVIIMASIENDCIMVSFGFECNAFFPIDALLVLRNPDEIRTDVENDATLLPFYDYYDILEIIAFAESTDMALRREAVVLSSKNPDAMEYTMISLSTVLGLKRNYSISNDFFR